MELKELLYTIAILPPFFLVIYILYMTFKRPDIISKASADASHDRPSAKSGLQALLGVFYSLDELRKMKEYKLIYVIGLIGIIGTAISIIIFTVVFYFVYYQRRYL